MVVGVGLRVLQRDLVLGIADLDDDLLRRVDVELPGLGIEMDADLVLGVEGPLVGGSEGVLDGFDDDVQR